MASGEQGVSATPLKGTGPLARRGARLAYLLLLAASLGYVASNLAEELRDSAAAGLPYLLLGVALLIALGFEFVNGFHDTANAVATVIYTRALTPAQAVVWSGCWNFIGVLLSSGAVAYAIVALLPVELILQVGSAAGFAMVFALLTAAILWNLGTWWIGLPNSSSHTLIGSIIGVGVANELLQGRQGTTGVDWGQAAQVGQSLLFSPLIGFLLAGVLLYSAYRLLPDSALQRAPDGRPPPPAIRALLILTSTGVSFAHGSNDGQKGMGLIMLVLIGTVPTAFALNRATTPAESLALVAAAEQAAESLAAEPPAGADYRGVVLDYLEHRTLEPALPGALAALLRDVAAQVQDYGSFAAVPPAARGNVRNDMFLAGEAARRLLAEPAGISPEAAAALRAATGHLDRATRFIPTWVKVSVALALGLGTMVGWRRIVVTVGEKIGKRHLTYGQGAAAELVAAGTIGAADAVGLPVSTTHVLSSGVAGTMAASGAGLRRDTLRNLAIAWILTLPAAMLLAGLLYSLFLLAV